jgi:hypothetical protein
VHLPLQNFIPSFFGESFLRESSCNGSENRQVGSDRISAYELTTRNHELEIVFSRLNLLAILNEALGRKTAIREPVLL